MKNKYSCILALIQPQFFLKPDKGGGDGNGEPDAPPAQSPSEFLASHPITCTDTVELKKLVTDAGTQPRVKIDDEVVAEYEWVILCANKAAQVNPFETLTADKLPQAFRDPKTSKLVLADGFHRLLAHKGAKQKEMKVAIRDGTAADALRFSLSTNQEHGVRRTSKDKQRAVKLALTDPQWEKLPNTEIAAYCGVSEFTVRSLRPAAKSPSTRQVTIRGKKTTMDVSGIGKGKGAGKKGKKAAAKASGKKAAAEDTSKTSSSEDAAAELDKSLIKIAEAIGGTEGGKFRSGVRDGVLDLSTRDIKDMASFAPAVIKRVAPLVTGGNRMKPAKAFDFVTSELAEKIVTELHNRALGSGNGSYVYETDSVIITAKHKAK